MSKEKLTNGLLTDMYIGQNVHNIREHISEILKGWVNYYYPGHSFSLRSLNSYMDLISFG